jgi:molybdopterin converting factor small subunit
MRILVQFYSYYRIIAGMESTSVHLPEDAVVSDLMEELGKQIPDLDQRRGQTAILVNQLRASTTTVLKDNDEVALLYLIGGG